MTDKSLTPPPPVIDKPTWRGVLHQWAAVFSLGIGVGLVALLSSARQVAAVSIYAASLATLFGVSAVYHRLHWQPAARAWLRRADHASIFLLIGGSYTPVALLGIGGAAGNRLLTAAWITCSVGIAVSLFWASAPKFVSALIAIGAGWTAVPYLGEFARALTTTEMVLVIAGGIAYTAGAIIYAVGRPNPWPRTFGYHEVFHLCTLVGAACHLVCVILILR